MSEPLLNDSSSTLQDIQNQLKLLSKKIKTCQNTAKNIGTPKDNEIFRDNLNKTVNNITKEFKDIRSKLLTLESSYNDNISNNSNQINKCKKYLRTEIDKFTVIVKDINIKQSKYTPFDPNHNIHNDNNNQNHHSIGNNINNQSGSQSNGQLQQQQLESQLQLQPDNYGDAYIRELEIREEKVYQIMKDVQDLQAMMEDLECLVDDQGSNIDIIVDNTNQVQQHVESGTSHLREAAKHQKKARKRLCYILIFLLIVVLIGVVWYLVSSNSNNN